MFYLRDNVHGTWTHQAISCICSWLNVRVNLKHLIIAKIISCNILIRWKDRVSHFLRYRWEHPGLTKRRKCLLHRSVGDLCGWRQASAEQGVLYTPVTAFFCSCTVPGLSQGKKPYQFQDGWLWFWEIRDYIKHSCHLLKEGDEAHYDSVWTGLASSSLHLKFLLMIIVW